MKMETKSQKGFTLVEFGIAMAAGAILVLAAGMTLVIGQKSWNEAWKRVNLQRDASYAMLIMSRSIQAATSAAVDANGGIALITYRTGNNVKFSRMTGTHNLQCQIGAGPQTLINDKVEYLYFDVNEPRHTVTINLGLKKGTAQAYFDSTVMMRN